MKTDLQNVSNILGGLLGALDYVRNNENNYTNNNYYKEYSIYIDEYEFKEGYSIGYNDEKLNMYSNYREKKDDEIINEIENVIKPFKSVKEGILFIEDGSFVIK